MRALVIYSSHEGQTERIAHRISGCLIEYGIPNDLFNVNEEHQDAISIDAYDAVVVGSPLHMGHHDSAIRRCIQLNRSFLDEVPTAFFSVGLGLVSKNEKDQEAAQKMAHGFLESMRWLPSMKEDFAGALRNSRYGWAKGRLMHWIAKASGVETDLIHDYEYTDWGAVDAFAVRFAEFVLSYAEPKPRRTGLGWSIHRIQGYSVN